MFTDGSEWQPGSGGMVCESCGDEPASVHVVRIEAGSVSHSHLCSDCAQDMTDQSEGASLVFALPSALNGLIAGSALESAGHRLGRQSLVCGVCGTSLTDLSHSGLLGCAACYEIFAEHLKGLGGSPAGNHLGKIPNRAPVGAGEYREVLRLKRMLDELVETERFEEAASVRDRLAELDRDSAAGA
jgi:protein arginine kinase activator